MHSAPSCDSRCVQNGPGVVDREVGDADAGERLAMARPPRRRGTGACRPAPAAPLRSARARRGTGTAQPACRALLAAGRRTGCEQAARPLVRFAHDLGRRAVLAERHAELLALAHDVVDLVLDRPRADVAIDLVAAAAALERILAAPDRAPSPGVPSSSTSPFHCRCFERQQFDVAVRARRTRRHSGSGASTRCSSEPSPSRWIAKAPTASAASCSPRRRTGRPTCGTRPPARTARRAPRRCRPGSSAKWP